MNPKQMILDRFHGDLALAFTAANWIMFAGVVLIGLATYNFLVAYQIIGADSDPDAVVEWLKRWREITAFERWTLLHAYSRMEATDKERFRDAWMENGCRVYHEFSAIENLFLMAKRDSWLIGEIYRAINPPESWVQHIPRVTRMTHLDRPVSAWQIVRMRSTKSLRTMGLVALGLGWLMYMILAS
jgi:hypothetical protein